MEICNQFKTLEPISSLVKNGKMKNMDKERASISEFYSANSKSQKLATLTTI